ncbi:hypothetical protein V2G26_008331 [Clonostachys chloroleuca]
MPYINMHIYIYIYIAVLLNQCASYERTPAGRAWALHWGPGAARFDALNSNGGTPTPKKIPEKGTSGRTTLSNMTHDPCLSVLSLDASASLGWSLVFVFSALY